MKFILLKNLADHPDPFEEDTRAWHVWLDLHHANKTVKGDEFTIEQLAFANGMPESYYENSLDELLAEEFITVKEET